MDTIPNIENKQANYKTANFGILARGLVGGFLLGNLGQLIYRFKHYTYTETSFYAGDYIHLDPSD